MEFNAVNFVNNLKYMGAGMLGIFIVMGVIILSIYGLGRLFGRAPKKKDDNSN